MLHGVFYKLLLVLILQKDPIELLDHFMCKVIFLCLLVLKEEGLCLSNNGIYEDY